MRPQDFRLVPVGIAVWAGTWLGIRGWGWWSLVGLVAVIIIPRRHRLTLLTAACAGCLAAAVGTGYLDRFLADPAAAIPAGADVIMQVRLVEDPQRRVTGWGSEQWDARSRVEYVEGEPSTAEVIIAGEQVRDSVRAQRLLVTGSIRKGFRDAPPSIGVLAVTNIRAKEPPQGWQRRAEHIRRALQRACQDLSPAARGLIPGMSVGDDRMVSAELKDNMKATSLVHLTAVSGAHLAIAVAALTALLPAGARLRALVAAVFALALLAVVGPEPSVLRAVGTCWVGAVGVTARRPGQPQASLSLVVILLAILSPWMVQEFGFALSVLATWGLIYSARDVSRAVPITNPFARFFVEAGIITVCAQLWAMPVLLLLRPEIPLWGPLANVAVAPAIPLVTLTGMVAAVVGVFSPGAATILCRVAEPGAWWIAQVARIGAALPGSQLPWLPGGIGISCWVLLISLVVWWQIRRRHTSGNDSRVLDDD